MEEPEMVDLPNTCTAAGMLERGEACTFKFDVFNDFLNLKNSKGHTHNAEDALYAGAARCPKHAFTVLPAFAANIYGIYTEPVRISAASF